MSFTYCLNIQLEEKYLDCQFLSLNLDLTLDQYKAHYFELIWIQSWFSSLHFEFSNFASSWRKLGPLLPTFSKLSSTFYILLAK